MMNIVRGEPFSISIGFDGSTESLRAFVLKLSQKGRCVLEKKQEDAAPGEDGLSALVTFTGAETATLSPYAPAYTQVRAELDTGEMLYSAVEEVNVVDVLDGREARHEYKNR